MGLTPDTIEFLASFGCIGWLLIGLVLGYRAGLQIGKRKQ